MRRKRGKKFPRTPVVTLTRMATGEILIETDDGRSWWTAHWCKTYSRTLLYRVYKGAVSEIPNVGDSYTFLDNKGYFAHPKVRK